MGRIEVRDARASDLPAALECWHGANVARAKVPGAARVERVRRKLADPAAHVLVAVSGGVTGMLLAEPGRMADGAGPPVPGLCHVSMVFVGAGWWARGVGTALLDALRERAPGLGYRRVQVWTGENNERALGLYRRAGFQPSGRRRAIAGAGTAVHLAMAVGNLTE